MTATPPSPGARAPYPGGADGRPDGTAGRSATPRPDRHTPGSRPHPEDRRAQERHLPEGPAPHLAAPLRAGHRRTAVRRTGVRPPTLVAVAHGSRDPAALRTVTALLDRVRELRPWLPVRLGHIELNEPLLPDTLAELAATDPGPATGGDGPAAVVVPLLLSRGHHVRHDIPRAVAATVPALRAAVAAPLGPHPLLAEALHTRLREAEEAAGTAGAAGRARRADGVVLAAAGSRDPDAAYDVHRAAALLSLRLGTVPVVPAYASAAAPTVPGALRALRDRGCRRIAVAAYFTAPGRFATACAEAAATTPGAGLAPAPLGAHPALARLVLHRYDEVLASALSGAGTAFRSAGPVPV
ncbi:sirohydrochlorin chelatase [Streptomyces zingiberis]|uniref:Sirohydrochlorin chelatase n=1 Tax=Streptomyces zingiberis TaxID=2053010 RepID=A0ABX1BXV1_9ACTN|nr:sirohydrochlorin chelatase [Streptomyces zingiberis]NJP99493.1 sirohydrochlorin chelatase [Streptomyces zingiberis]